MIEGDTVSHLVARVMHQGVPGGNHNMKPAIFHHADGFHLRLVRADQVTEVLGKVTTPYKDEAELTNQILEAHRKWGYPTADRIVEAIPKIGKL